MPKDPVKANSSQTSGRSAAANNRGAGISLPAVNPFGPRNTPLQLMKLTSKTLGKTIETTTETDIKLLKQFRTRFLNQPTKLAAIDERIEQLESVNPFTGFVPAIPGQKPGSSGSTKHKTPLLPPGKRSEKQGQSFKEQDLPRKFTPLTKPVGNLSSVPRLKVNKLQTWDGQPLKLQWYLEMRGDTEVQAPYIQCSYTLDWIRAEEADLDHVVPTEKLRIHLHNIAKRMNSEAGYSDSVKKWLSDAGLKMKYWFIEEGGQWVPTQWAMFELHNSKENIVFSSKYFNQQSKNNKSTLELILENPWYGEFFFKQHQFLQTVNEGLGSVEGEGIGYLLETHLQEHHKKTSKSLSVEKKGERKMSTRIKQRGLGKLSDERRKSLSRKLILREDIAELSSDASSGSEDEFEDKNVGREKILRSLISSTGLEDQFPTVGSFQEAKDENERLKQELEELRVEKERVEAQLGATKSKKKKEKKKKEKEEKKKKKDVESSDEEIDSREEKDKEKKGVKRHRSTDAFLPVKKRNIANEQLVSHYKMLDKLMEEKAGTNQNRIEGMRGRYGNAGAFINHYISLIKQQYGVGGWQNWVSSHQQDWANAKHYLERVYDL